MNISIISLVDTRLLANLHSSRFWGCLNPSWKMEPNLCWTWNYPTFWQNYHGSRKQFNRQLWNQGTFVPSNGFIFDVSMSFTATKPLPQSWKTAGYLQGNCYWRVPFFTEPWLWEEGCIVLPRETRRSEGSGDSPRGLPSRLFACIASELYSSVLALPEITV